MDHKRNHFFKFSNASLGVFLMFVGLSRTGFAAGSLIYSSTQYITYSYKGTPANPSWTQEVASTCPKGFYAISCLGCIGPQCIPKVTLFDSNSNNTIGGDDVWFSSVISELTNSSNTQGLPTTCKITRRWDFTNPPTDPNNSLWQIAQKEIVGARALCIKF